MLLFDKIVETYEDYKYSDGPVVLISDIAYSGTLETLAAELTAALRDPGIVYFGAHSEGALERMILHPPRIIRAIVDYKINLCDKGAETSEIEKLLENTISIGLHTYSLETALAAQMLDAIAAELKENHGDLWQKAVSQPHDYDTACAMYRTYTSECASKIAQQLDKSGVLFICIGHGSIASGMDTYLRYCALSGMQDNEFYVVRCSRKRHLDDAPKLSATEKELLKQKAHEKKIVLYDDISSSGTTLNSAAKYFANIFPGTKINAFYSSSPFQDALSTDG